jgi:hypothetical protein
LQQDVEHYKKCYTEEHGRANHMAALLHDALEELEGVKRERDDLQQNLLENVNLCGKERVEHRTVMARLQDTLSVMQSKAEATHSRKAELEGAVDTMNVTITGEREVTFRVLKEHQVRGEKERYGERGRGRGGGERNRGKSVTIWREDASGGKESERWRRERWMGESENEKEEDGGAGEGDRRGRVESGSV